MTRVLCSIFITLISSTQFANADLGILGAEAQFASIHSVSESCVVTNKAPGGDYSKKDIKKENKYCAIDFNGPTFALCPKTWSTSPGTMVYDLSKSEFSPSSYESSSYCGKKSRGPGVKTAVKFKQTMNADGTSGTFSKSSLLYYHFSRLLDTKTKVPVAVYREMDRKAHRERVSATGVNKAKGAMNKAGWKKLYSAENKPNNYSPTDDLFTADREKIYGVLLKGSGNRYGTEFNGTRASGWGSGQNKDFQKTPGFLALRSSKPLMDAIEYSIAQAKKDSKMRPDIVDVADLQVVYWMRELIEITLLDYIFSQQDRVGNIDYEWYWFWVENGKVEKQKEDRKEYKDKSRRQIGSIPIPEEIATFSPVLIQRTNINDNDAGGRVAYANFTKKTKMLSNLKHYSAKLYNKLMALDSDLQNQGEVYQWLSSSLGLSARQVKQVVTNTKLAADLLRGQCNDLQFDLDDVDNFLMNGPRIETVDCSQ